MGGISKPTMVTLTTGGEEVIFEAPGVVTSVIAAELAGAPAQLVLTGAHDVRMHMTVAVPADGTVVWSGEGLVFASGCKVAAGFGDVAVTVGWR